MVTNDERREVARMLRELPGDSTYPDLIGVIADRDGWYPASDAADRLADLIEPPTQCPYYHSDRHYCSIHDVPAIDRDALLALASGLEADADRIIRAARNARFGGGPRMGEAKHDAYDWRSMARRIREACGEVGA